MTSPVGGIGGGAFPGAVRGVGVPGAPSVAGADPAGEGSFADTLKRFVGEVSDAQGRSGDAIQGFLRGEEVELHEVMAAAEEAGIALEMLIEIRNKLTEAYRTVIGMQS